MWKKHSSDWSQKKQVKEFGQVEFGPGGMEQLPRNCGGRGGDGIGKYNGVMAVKRVRWLVRCRTVGFGAMGEWVLARGKGRGEKAKGEGVCEGDGQGRVGKSKGEGLWPMVG